MSQDISHIIGSWEFDPQKTYRRVVGDDGREKIQVRVDNAAFQGVLQMDLDGRPDGKRPYGSDYTMDYYRQSLERYLKAHGSDQGFQLEHEACAELFDESLRIYNRYIFMLQLQDYPRVIRDTEHNMEIFRFVNRYAREKEDRENLEKWWPYIIRINGTARAMLAIQEGRNFEKAFMVIRDTRKKIESLQTREEEEFHAELKRSRKALKELEKALSIHKPLTEKDRLLEELEKAVDMERYEDAARLRDQIRDLEKKKPGTKSNL